MREDSGQLLHCIVRMAGRDHSGILMELWLGFSQGGQQLFLPTLLQYPEKQQEVPMPVGTCSEIAAAAGTGVGVGYYFGAQSIHLLQPRSDAAVALIPGVDVQDVYDQQTRLNDGFPALAKTKQKKQKKQKKSHGLEARSWRELMLQTWSLLRYVGQAQEQKMRELKEGIFRIRLLYSDFGSQSKAGHFDPDGFRLLHLMVKPKEVSASSDRSHLFAFSLVQSDSDEGHDDDLDVDSDDGPGEEEGQQERSRAGQYYYYQLLVLLLALLLLVLLLLVLLTPTTTSTPTPTTTITTTTTTTTTYYQFYHYYYYYYYY